MPSPFAGPLPREVGIHVVVHVATVTGRVSMQTGGAMGLCPPDLRATRVVEGVVLTPAWLAQTPRRVAIQ